MQLNMGTDRGSILALQLSSWLLPGAPGCGKRKGHEQTSQGTAASGLRALNSGAADHVVSLYDLRQREMPGKTRPWAPAPLGSQHRYFTSPYLWSFSQVAFSSCSSDTAKSHQAN